MCKALKGGEVDEPGEQINRTIAKVWARVEVLVRIFKRQFGFVKTRQWRLVKSRAHLFAPFALYNLFLTHFGQAAHWF